MYEVFAKENARAAGQANYQEGKAWNEKYYSDGHSDWTYYNSDYYYQCNDTNAALRESARKMTEKWELDGIDCDEIEANSSLTLDGGLILTAYGIRILGIRLEGAVWQRNQRSA